MNIPKLNDLDQHLLGFHGEFTGKYKTQYNDAKAKSNHVDDDDINEFIKLYEDETYYISKAKPISLKKQEEKNRASEERKHGLALEGKVGVKVIERIRKLEITSGVEDRFKVLTTEGMITKMESAKDAGTYISDYTLIRNPRNQNHKLTYAFDNNFCDMYDCDYITNFTSVDSQQGIVIPDQDIVIFDKHTNKIICVTNSKGSPKDANVYSQVSICERIRKNCKIQTFAYNWDGAKHFLCEDELEKQRNVLAYAQETFIEIYTPHTKKELISNFSSVDVNILKSDEEFNDDLTSFLSEYQRKYVDPFNKGKKTIIVTPHNYFE